ncbi:MAG TPA: PVC-type heme-binding CxxCH protein [Planctomycetaceae bacterium]|nr:PVC-type heme-binding CxxCH protein [Planctomycetaceae bacterium]
MTDSNRAALMEPRLEVGRARRARALGLAALVLAFFVKSSCADDGPLPPAEAATRFVIHEDLELEQALAEPIVRQPVFLNFDERGRMWVVQYIQYPNPAGLEMISRDKFWRAVYDKVPQPPPLGERGLDKITIHEDTDGDGKFDRHKTFVEGLNIATACVKGRGGVWVLNPPYLLFYPDADNDDVPDGDPVVHLAGFGMEDTHSVVNSLCWGPDGWLYAAQGSTVTGHVKRPGIDKQPVHSMGQLIWRYHPETKRYEIFAEGGGNAFGVEIDAKGRIFSGHNGGDTRGFHYAQGAYLQKGFAKHGPLSNPYAFGYFPAMKHHNVPRFTHTFLIYGGNSLPERYRGKLFGVATLLSHVVYSDIELDGASFKTSDLGHPVTTTDTWFRPVDIKAGPDGALYIADWYDRQTNHYRNHEGQIDTSNGRIYRLAAKGAGRLPSFDLARHSTPELIALLEHPDKWHRQTALRILGDRKDASAIGPLRDRLDAATGQTALETLWALNLSGGFNEEVGAKLLDHTDPYVRLWAVRLLGDANVVSAKTALKIAQRALSETHVEVRSQLASTARRLPAGSGLAIVADLLVHDEDADDIHLPLLLWWAIEARCETDRELVLSLFSDPGLWTRRIVAEQILPRLMQRFAASGHRKDLLICARLLAMSPDKAATSQLMKGFEEAFRGRTLSGIPDELAKALEQWGGESDVLALRRGRADAIDRSLKFIGDNKADVNKRVQLIQAFGEIQEPKCVPALLKLVRESRDDVLRMAALSALAFYNDAVIGPEIIRAWGNLTDDVRQVALSILASRKAWALELLTAVNTNRIDRGAVSTDVVRRMTAYRDDRIAQLISRHFGSVEGATTAEMQHEIERLAKVLKSEAGDPYLGKKLFTAQCAKCHTLFGQGGQIGPDLTTFKRDDVDNMLLSVVNPSAEIREGFETLLVVTDDGRTASGFLIDRDSQVLVLRGSDGQSTTIAQNKIEETLPQRKSMMPEGLLKDYSDQQVRNLFAYLRSTQPLNE